MALIVNYMENIDKMVEAGCEVIVCASRTKGWTKDNVIKAAGENGYRLIWTSHYSVDNPSLQKLGKTSEEINMQNYMFDKEFAKNIKSLIDNILLVSAE